jgi:hypothetical protein
MQLATSELVAEICRHIISTLPPPPIILSLYIPRVKKALTCHCFLSKDFLPLSVFNDTSSASIYNLLLEIVVIKTYEYERKHQNFHRRI